MNCYELPQLYSSSAMNGNMLWILLYLQTTEYKLLDVTDYHFTSNLLWTITCYERLLYFHATVYELAHAMNSYFVSNLLWTITGCKVLKINFTSSLWTMDQYMLWIVTLLPFY